MPRRFLYAGTFCLAAACTRTLYSSYTARSTAAPPEAFECARSQLQTLGYKQSSYDTDAHRVTGEKEDPKRKIADIRFRRMVNRVEVEVASGTEGESTLNVHARSIGLYDNQRGFSEVEETASDEVQQDAALLLERCGVQP